LKRKRDEEEESSLFFCLFFYLFLFIYLFYLFYLVDLDEPFVVHPTPDVRTKQVAAIPQRQPSPLPVKPKRQSNPRHPSDSTRTELRRIVNLKGLSIFDMCELISHVIKPYLVNKD
jgi:hypothetical protein